VLTDALWPEADPRRSFARLHTAVYDLRRFLEPAHELRHSVLLRHSGQAYRLALPPGSSSDVTEFEEAWAAARTAVAGGDRSLARASLQAAVTAYGGELLPEAGPAEWLQEQRTVLRQRARWAERALTELGG
jgi:DNA-binding SARP family transcriptional activator